MKKILSTILVVVLVLSSISFAFAANLGKVTYSANTSLKSKFNSFESLTLKAGVTLTTAMSGSEPQGIEMHGPLVLEDGAKITGKGIIMMFKGSSYSGIKLYYQLADGEVKELPDMDTAYEKYQMADDYVYTFSCDSQGRWVMVDVIANDPFAVDDMNKGPQTSYPDMRKPSDWSYDALNYAIRNNLIDGVNGKLLPGEHATRAVLATAINRMFGAIEKADISNFTDVKPSDSFYEDMQKSVKMKIFSGDGNGHLFPTNPVSRQEAFMVFALALNLKSDNTDVLNRFSDANSVASWSAPYLAALVENGYVQGNGVSLNPLGTITREELAKLLNNIFTTVIAEPGDYVRFDDGNVVVRVPGVTIKNTDINGDLIIGDGVGDGEVIIDNVNIKGRLIVRSGEQSVKLLHQR